ncbi:MAG: hypothetical protein KDI44_06135 [Thiothrix sp.]|nr:hypothetical protein [Thiothrix sp.]HPQ96919.1 hypothetical protein [Thiolinea sp.]
MSYSKNITIQITFESTGHIRKSGRAIKVVLDDFCDALKKIDGFESIWAEYGDLGGSELSLESLINQGIDRSEMMRKSREAMQAKHKPREDAAYALWKSWPEKGKRGARERFIEAASEKFGVDSRTVKRWLSGWKR